MDFDLMDWIGDHLGMIFFLIILVFVGGFTGCNLNGCNNVYSTGERIGQVYKFSQKGFIFKTWEGEMNLGGMVSDGKGGTSVNTWKFSVTPEKTDLIKFFQSALDQENKVKAYYKQVWWSSCIQADTQYQIQSAELVK